MANYPVPYQTNWNYGGVGQQMYQQPMMQQPQMSGTVQQNPHGLIWVDGEVGAKAFQLPQGLPANQPVALWDTNDTVIYLKSMNPMGMPNPLQKAHYTLEEQRTAHPTAASGAQETEKADMREYVRKEDMERMKQELMNAINSVNTSGAASGNSQNRRPMKGES